MDEVYAPIGTTWRETAAARYEIMKDLREAHRGLEAQVAEPRNDTARLDALLAGGWTFTSDHRGWKVWGANLMLIGSGATAREALDVAMARKSA